MKAGASIPAEDTPLLPRAMERQRFPILTILIISVTAVGAAAQLSNPQVFYALRRDPDALAAGQWWRAFSSLVVLDGEVWSHFMLDTLGLVLVGVVVERLIGGRRWFVLFVAGALAGQIAGYAWDPYGAGASSALCGLIGGLVIWQIRRHDLRFIASIYAVGLVSALATQAVMTAVASDSRVSIVVSAIVTWLLINALLLLRRRNTSVTASAYYVGAVILLGAVLVVQRDIHGVALLAGLGAATLLLLPIFKSEFSAPQIRE